MGSRLELHSELSKAFASLGEWHWPSTMPETFTDEELYDEIYNNHVHFQPSASVFITYPCIVYKQSTGSTKHANNFPYNFKKRYLITVIDRDPDSPIPGAIGKISGCQLDRVYSNDNLYHWSFNLYY